jgi:hypothetical protein
MSKTEKEVSMPRPKMLPSDRASAIVEERKGQYGHPADVYARVAGMWASLFGWDVKVEDVSLALSCVKIAREKNSDYEQPDEVNVDDMAGYANVLALIKADK